jgi:hypothetical protein
MYPPFLLPVSSPEGASVREQFFFSVPFSYSLFAHFPQFVWQGFGLDSVEAYESSVFYWSDCFHVVEDEVVHSFFRVCAQYVFPDIQDCAQAHEFSSREACISAPADSSSSQVLFQDFLGLIRRAVAFPFVVEFPCCVDEYGSSVCCVPVAVDHGHHSLFHEFRPWLSDGQRHYFH